jgi:hypothetical protein
MSEQRYDLLSAAYRGPAVYQGPGALVPVAPAAAPAEKAGRAFSRVHWAWPLAATGLPLALGRMWHVHGGHSIGAWGIGLFGAVGLGFAVAQREDAAVAGFVAGLSGLVVDFAICAYAPEVYLPLGLTGLASIAVYGVVARLWWKARRQDAKAAAKQETEATRAATTVQVAQVRAWERVTVAAIEADAQVRIATRQADAQVQVAQVQASALGMLRASNPLLQISPTARAMLEGRAAYELEVGGEQVVEGEVA